MINPVYYPLADKCLLYVTNLFLMNVHTDVHDAIYTIMDSALSNIYSLCLKRTGWYE